MSARLFTADFVAKHQAKHGRTVSNVDFNVPVKQPGTDTPPERSTLPRVGNAPARGAGSKYSNVKDGAHDSRKEGRRARELALLEKAGEIRDLQHHREFLLVPEQRDPSGALIERAVHYEADFTYTHVASGELVVEDTKGVRTPLYVVKRKLMLHVHRIRVRET